MDEAAGEQISLDFVHVSQRSDRHGYQNSAETAGMGAHKVLVGHSVLGPTSK